MVQAQACCEGPWRAAGCPTSPQASPSSRLPRALGQEGLNKIFNFLRASSISDGKSPTHQTNQGYALLWEAKLKHNNPTKMQAATHALLGLQGSFCRGHHWAGRQGPQCKERGRARAEPASVQPLPEKPLSCSGLSLSRGRGPSLWTTEGANPGDL